MIWLLSWSDCSPNTNILRFNYCGCHLLKKTSHKIEKRTEVGLQRTKIFTGFFYNGNMQYICINNFLDHGRWFCEVLCSISGHKPWHANWETSNNDSLMYCVLMPAATDRDQRLQITTLFRSQYVKTHAVCHTLLS